MKRNRLKHPVTAGSVLGKVLGEMGMSASISKHKVVQLWPKIVDSTVSRHTKAERVEGSILFILVDSSVWMNELSAIKNVLLDKVNSRIGSKSRLITDIRFNQRSWARQEASVPAGTVKPAEITDKDVRLIRTVLEPVKDLELKAVIKRILEKDTLLKKPREQA